MPDMLFTVYVATMCAGLWLALAPLTASPD
jgi:hypothetical protein